MTWRQDQLSGGWVDPDQPRAFVGSASREELRVVLPDGRETLMPFDSYHPGMTLWSSLPQRFTDGSELTASDLESVEVQVRDAVASSGYSLTVSRG